MTVDQGSSAGTSNDAQAAAVSALEAGANGGGGQAPAQQQGQQPQQQNAPAAGQDNGLANPFLEGVAPADRPIVEKYIKDWDAGVTKRFEELHGKLQPWEQLGADPETAAQAMQLLQMIDTEPEQVLSLLQRALQEGEDEPQGQPNRQQGSPDGDDPMASLPPAFVERFNQIEQVLEMLAGDHLTQREQQTQAQEDKQLDDTLASLHEQHGDFDEQYVLALMMAGQEPEAAVQAFQKAVQGQVNARSQIPPVPAILGGGGAAPQQQQDITKASSKDVKSLVANLLRQSAQQ